jgi:hypothetical protein
MLRFSGGRMLTGPKKPSWERQTLDCVLQGKAFGSVHIPLVIKGHEDRAIERAFLRTDPFAAQLLDRMVNDNVRSIPTPACDCHLRQMSRCERKARKMGRRGRMILAHAYTNIATIKVYQTVALRQIVTPANSVAHGHRHAPQSETSKSARYYLLLAGKHLGYVSSTRSPVLHKVLAFLNMIMSNLPPRAPDPVGKTRDELRNDYRKLLWQCRRHLNGVIKALRRSSYTETGSTSIQRIEADTNHLVWTDNQRRTAPQSKGYYISDGLQCLLNTVEAHKTELLRREAAKEIERLISFECASRWTAHSRRSWERLADSNSGSHSKPDKVGRYWVTIRRPQKTSGKHHYCIALGNDGKTLSPRLQTGVTRWVVFPLGFMSFADTTISWGSIGNGKTTSMEASCLCLSHDNSTRSAPALPANRVNQFANVSFGDWPYMATLKANGRICLPRCVPRKVAEFDTDGDREQFERLALDAEDAPREFPRRHAVVQRGRLFIFKGYHAMYLDGAGISLNRGSESWRSATGCSLVNKQADKMSQIVDGYWATPTLHSSMSPRIVSSVCLPRESAWKLTNIASSGVLTDSSKCGAIRRKWQWNRLTRNASCFATYASSSEMGIDCGKIILSVADVLSTEITGLDSLSRRSGSDAITNDNGSSSTMFANCPNLLS